MPFLTRYILIPVGILLFFPFSLVFVAHHLYKMNRPAPRWWRRSAWVLVGLYVADMTITSFIPPEYWWTLPFGMMGLLLIVLGIVSAIEGIQAVENACKE